MNIKTHFENIRERIIEELKKANTSIFIAVAWFTDRELFEILCQKASLGVKVELIANKDEINTSSSINFSDLFEKGGKIWLVEEQKIMHNKFCIIDEKVVINGSFNWTYNANYNHENIMVISNHNESVENYIEQFRKIKKLYFGTDKEAYKKLSLRLSTLLNLILLKDKKDIEIQINKILKLSLFVTIKQFKDLQSIFQLIENGNRNDSITLINKLIHESNNHLSEEDIIKNTYCTIFDAAQNNSITGVKLLLEKGVKINVKDKEKNTALHYAAKNSYYQLLVFLLNNKASVNLINQSNEYPIDLLRPENNTQIYINCFELLLNKNAKIDPSKQTLSRFLKFLLQSYEFDKVESLISKFTNLEKYFQHKLFYGFFFSDRNDIKDFLIRNGFNINDLNTENQHILEKYAKIILNDWYFYESGIANMKYLLDNGIEWQQYFPNVNFIEVLLNSGKYFSPNNEIDFKGRTIFEFILIYNYSDTIFNDSIEHISKFVFELEFQIFFIDENGNEKLRFKISNDLLKIFVIILEKRKYHFRKDLYSDKIFIHNKFLYIVKKILRLNSFSKNEMTILAAEYVKKGLFELVNELVVNGADVNVEIEIDTSKVYFPENLSTSIQNYYSFIIHNYSTDLESMYKPSIFNWESIQESKNNIYKTKSSPKISNYKNHISLLEFSKRSNQIELVELLISYGATTSENDKFNFEIENENINTYNLEQNKQRLELEASQNKHNGSNNLTSLKIKLLNMIKNIKL